MSETCAATQCSLKIYHFTYQSSSKLQQKKMKDFFLQILQYFHTTAGHQIDSVSFKIPLEQTREHSFLFHCSCFLLITSFSFFLTLVYCPNFFNTSLASIKLSKRFMCFLARQFFPSSHGSTFNNTDIFLCIS